MDVLSKGLYTLKSNAALSTDTEVSAVVYSSDTAQNAFDGDLLTTWQVNETNGTMKIVFDEPQTFDTVVLSNLCDANATCSGDAGLCVYVKVILITSSLYSIA